MFKYQKRDPLTRIERIWSDSAITSTRNPLFSCDLLFSQVSCTKQLYLIKLTNLHSFFNKNHVFQNEAGLFLIFFKNRGSIVLNLFLNLTKSFRKKRKKTRVNHNNILFFKAVLFGTEFFYWSFFLIHFLYFLLYLSSFFFFKFEAHCS